MGTSAPVNSSAGSPATAAVAAAPTASALRVLSGGAAQALVGRLTSAFQARTGYLIDGRFGAVGSMRDALLAGQPCDVMILTDGLVRELAAQGWADAATARPLGVVRTGVAVPHGRPRPAVATPADLAAALRAAGGIYHPDPVKATAGIHFMSVLRKLGLDGELASRLRPYPNGNAAMRAMAQSGEADALGCTQVTEILYTEGVTLVGKLPPEFELATVYTAVICTQAQAPGEARVLLELLAAPEAADTRRELGFESA